MRLINYDAVMAALEEEYQMQDHEKTAHEMLNVVKYFPTISPEPHWIPVTERLPEDKQAVLVWCPQYKNIYCAYLEKEQWWIFGAFVQIVPNEVVAWMPLPSVYKENGNEGP